MEGWPRRGLNGRTEPSWCIYGIVFTLMARLFVLLCLFILGFKVSLWDGIIPAMEHAKFPIHTTNKYKFIDQGSNLKGKDFNLTMHRHIIPKTGKMFADKIVMTGYQLPEQYR